MAKLDWEKSVKNSSSTVIGTAKCNPKYFGSIDTHIDPEVLEYYMCPVAGYSFKVEGSYTSGISYQAVAGVSLCNQANLNDLHPDKKWTCINSPDKLRHVLQHTEL